MLGSSLSRCCSLELRKRLSTERSLKHRGSPCTPLSHRCRIRQQVVYKCGRGQAAWSSGPAQLELVGSHQAGTVYATGRVRKARGLQANGMKHIKVLAPALHRMIAIAGRYGMICVEEALQGCVSELLPTQQISRISSLRALLGTCRGLAALWTDASRPGST